MTIDYYYAALSPYCQSIQITAAALGVELNLKPTNSMAGETRTPEFIKMNPQHTIPTIKDGDFVLWESRAILGYLVNKYGKDDSLYPTDPVKRARVDQKLYFDMGTLSQRLQEYLYPQFLKKEPADPEKLKKLEEAVGFLNTALEGQKYVAGDQLTIADFALFTTGCCLKAIKIPFENYPNLKRWHEELKPNIPGYETIAPGLETYKTFVENI